MVSLDRFEVPRIPDYVYFYFECCFHNEPFKNGTNPRALKPRIPLRSRISRILYNILGGAGLRGQMAGLQDQCDGLGGQDGYLRRPGR
jgi:hypothetical protein